ncbi:MAG: hydroxylamine reductase [Thermotogae bacterium]|nr:hydroxylamine reductase [Thermotogota bacterium]
MSMFCFQCSETLNGKGCTVSGICGKDEMTANLQDLLIWVLKGLSYWAVKARKLGIEDPEANLFVAEGLFTTITNVNFDPESIGEKIEKAFELRKRLEQTFKKSYIEKEGKEFSENVPEAATWYIPKNLDAWALKGAEVGVLSTKDEDIRSLRELLTYGLKGIAAYTDHAYILQKFNDKILHFIQEGLAATLDDNLTVNDYVNLVIKAGNYAVEAMKLLDEANTSRFGNPEITEVYTGTIKGPAILVSGHDLLDLEEILIQTEGKGINVYTHGEMLPANAYPGLKKYKHLIGNYGGSWYRQQKEFSEFNGAIVMTTNCIQKPLESYRNRIFTTGLVGWPGVKHIPNRTDGKPKDFTPVIEKALELGNLEEKPGKKIVIGFARNQLAQLTDKIIEAIKAGKIKRFVVMAGCDGRFKEREYYTELAKKLPQDHVILTAGCAKYRYNMLDLGDVDGIPRVIDAGQCNDSYSLVVTALKLKEALGLNDINDLPISYDIAWYEQKAVTVLLALLYLGVKHIRLGPVLPAFISPNVLKVLVENFDIKPIKTVEEDLEAILQGK